ncbi:MAG TPA: NAD-glutamate dehydrogenase domain-containing protein, partial [Hyphomicrobiaceae bacterium]|nr:NAD-glutamate dehydrogenase domain-containing protein [Hyphomicrobiaceae bacterium]
QDRIVRQFLGLITATVRTNFFQKQANGAPADTIAYKFESKQISGLPAPRPFREIWVASPRVEGVHLRFAPIARGGLRWSDRPQDFRTEVLGLAKAQQVKNTVIVPEGAKGGFVPKWLGRATTREEIQAEGIAAYRIFISAMLDITDNIVDRVIVPPRDVVRREEDDPYLVVAADKGTATFSDIANEISMAKNHWLQDAFASGGSAGYDHKKMGITARGAWECVKRHFRERNTDIQTTPFTVAGVGDMSGDVFGNGMLLSRKIRLVAAFDHRDIFIDPDPDPEVSFQERQRLFEEPRSSWQDYDKTKRSRGGGVFPRSAKSITATPEMQALLGLASAAVTPAELMSAILRANVDLLWFGGVGTYIRGEHETNEAAGDRTNDAIRVTSADVKAKVIGEGANMGVTQQGRIAFAASGGGINTDFIDNSAGVSSSDKEVNIKIALGTAIASGRLEATARNDLLASMTDDVAAACLVDNYQQGLAISLERHTGEGNVGPLQRLMHRLEARGLLDRELESLPADHELTIRAENGRGLERPEIAVLVSYSKIALTADLVHTDIPDDPGSLPLLIDYFPNAMRDRFREDLAHHQLRREIIVTRIANSIINRAGPAAVIRLIDETGREASQIAPVLMATRSIFGLPDLWAKIDALDGRIDGHRQLDLYAATRAFLVDQTARFLRMGEPAGFEALVQKYRAAVASELPHLKTLMASADTSARGAMDLVDHDGGLPNDLADAIACLQYVGMIPVARVLADATNKALKDALEAQWVAARYLRLDEVRDKLAAAPMHDYYDQLATRGAFANLDAAARSLASRLLVQSATQSIDGYQAWLAAAPDGILTAKSRLDDVIQGGDISVSRLTVAASQVQQLATN